MTAPVPSSGLSAERIALAVQRVQTELVPHIRDMAETFKREPNLYRQDVEDLEVLLSALASAREETAQAVRVEPDADLVAFAAWMLRCSHGVDLPEQARMLVEDFARSRSLPGETADA